LRHQAQKIYKCDRLLVLLVNVQTRWYTFTKTGGIIYGNDADGNSNTVASGGGYAVGISENNPGVEKNAMPRWVNDHISTTDLRTNWDN
jgi:hypothetical protein